VIEVAKTYHLETNDTTTNDDHLLGNLGEGKGAGAGDDALLINGEAGEVGGFGASGDDDVLSAQGLLTTVVEGDLDGVGVDERSGTLDVVNAVLLEEELDTFGQTIDGLVLGLEHLGQVELDIADLDTALLGIVQNLVVEVGVVEEGLGGNAADVQTGTTEFSALLNTRGLARCSVSILRLREQPNWEPQSLGVNVFAP
jgi:hypothetical protein